MPKWSSKKTSRDINILASQIVSQATGEDIPKAEDLEKNPHAVELGRLGGLKGGKARANKLTPERRREIAQKAAKARWHKYINLNPYIRGLTIYDLTPELAHPGLESPWLFQYE